MRGFESKARRALLGQTDEAAVSTFGFRYVDSSAQNKTPQTQF